MTSRGSSVVTVTRPSPAARAGVRKGDIILACNGTPVIDWVDVLANSSPGKVDLQVRRGLSQKHLVIRRRPGENLGVHLADSCPRTCCNRCVFCFVEQQPSGLRSSLLVKDDDVRFSFLQGTYITLTDGQTAEAVSRGFNTLHVSVHATDPELRGRLLGRPGSMPVLPNIDLLMKHGTEIQAQVVEIPGWNSGSVLQRTIAELYSRSNVAILGVVPVGLTGHRNGLTKLRRPDSAQAEATLNLISFWQKKAGAERGFPWVFAGDEYYLLSGREIPNLDFYDECTLQANGIGLLAKEKEAASGKTFSGKGAVFTGELAFPFIAGLLNGSSYEVFPVKNRLMGGAVGVAGLISGADVIRTHGETNCAHDDLYLPEAMFNHERLTLDGLSPEDISEALDTSVKAVRMIGDLP